ncbi:lysozyme [Caulobacter sp. Root655]|uniref:lysozyme-family localization factor SpmX n=1 Tax=Caulobacter sp. Root655 TaxID=1736578 RepID=UPI0006F56D14|nr:lysozyme-family localization factor SpmX [Caulobacter sp. Root655]KRA59381.1 lysozyme [Caulobacter sp. Root655]
MKPRYQVSRAAVDLIKRFEGYRMKAAQLADGRWTLGYGHTLTARVGASVSEQDAEALLLYDLITVAHAVNENVYTPLNQNQFDALVCFAFNIGTENFVRSGVLRRLNEGSLLQAACAMEMWRKADFEGERIVIDALVRRRSAEKTLFLTPADGGWVAAPSSVLRPRIDHDAGHLIPAQTPAAITTSLLGDRAIALREDGDAVPLVENRGPSASEQAAAAVGARLEAILPDEGVAAIPIPAPPLSVAAPVQDLVLPEPPVPAAAAPAPAVYQAPEALVAVEPVAAPFQLTPEEPVAEPLFAPQPTIETPSASEPNLFETARPAAGGSLFNLGGFSTSAAEVDLGPQEVPFAEAQPHAFGGVSLLVSLGLLGLALFGGGILWNLSVGAGEGLSPIRMFGWAASVIGMICFATSAYLLMRRLGDPEPQVED